MAKNKHLAAKPNEKEKMNVLGHLPAGEDDKLGKDTVINPNKNDEVSSVSPKKSYLNVAKTPQSASKHGDAVHSSPASPSAEVGAGDVKKQNLADRKVKENEEEEEEGKQKFQ
jgi:hypothetical protein